MDNKQIIQEVIQTLLESNGGEKGTFFQRDKNGGPIFKIIDGPNDSKLIAISGFMEDQSALSLTLGIPNERLIEAFRWIGDGKFPCRSRESEVFYEAIISTDESLWPELSYREIIQKVIDIIDSIDESEIDTSLNAAQEISIQIELESPSNIIGITSALEGDHSPNTLAKKVSVSTKRLIEAFKWVGSGKYPCTFKKDGKIFQLYFTIAQDYWPES